MQSVLEAARHTVVGVGAGAGGVMDSDARVAVVDRAGPLVVGVVAILVHAVEGEIANPAHTRYTPQGKQRQYNAERGQHLRDIGDS